MRADNQDVLAFCEQRCAVGRSCGSMFAGENDPQMLAVALRAMRLGSAATSHTCGLLDRPFCPGGAGGTVKLDVCSSLRTMPVSLCLSFFDAGHCVQTRVSTTARS